MRFMAQEMREYMAKLGIHTVDELVGRSDLLVQKQYPAGTHESKIDMSKILTNPYAKEDSHVKMHFVPEDVYDFKLDKTIDETVIIPVDERGSGEETEKGDQHQCQQLKPFAGYAVWCRDHSEILQYPGR